MTINGNRRFNFNGKRYFIQDLPKQDREYGKKYFITFDVNGIWKTAYNNICWNIEKFATIKDAQRYVRNWDFLLDTF